MDWAMARGIPTRNNEATSTPRIRLAARFGLANDDANDMPFDAGLMMPKRD
jgi:hypothetical protein